MDYFTLKLEVTTIIIFFQDEKKIDDFLVICRILSLIFDNAQPKSL